MVTVELEVPTEPREGRSPQLWDAVDVLIDRAPSIAALREHRLHLLAGRRWRSLGRPVAGDIVVDELCAAMTQLAVRPLLERAREAVDGPILVFKGPEVAALYPDPVLRSFGDVDALVRDPESAQRALIAAGFREVGDPSLFVGIHHLRPLRWPGLPLTLEVHMQPKWVEGAAPPSFEELAEGAGPSSSGVDEVRTLGPEHHALVLAVHSWAHQPLRQISELVDIAAVGRQTTSQAVDDLARAWNVQKLWRTTSAVIDAVLYGRPRTWHLLTWARSVPAVRMRTVLEMHLEPLLAPFGAETLPSAFASASRAAVADLRPKPSERWPRKIRRTTRALRDALESRSEHERDLEQRKLL